MTRRDLIILFGSTTVAWPLAVRSQQPANDRTTTTPAASSTASRTSVIPNQACHRGRGSSVGACCAGGTGKTVSRSEGQCLLRHEG
jgi:hypothetical protein